MNIRQKFVTLLLGIGLVPTLLVSLVSFITISSQLNQRTATQLASIDIKEQQAISSLLQTKQQEVIKLAEEYDFQVALQGYLTTRSAADENAVVAILDSKLSEASGLEGIHVADQNGNVIASTDPTEVGKQLSGEPSVGTTYQGPEISIEQDPSTGLQELYITTGLSVNDQYPATLRAIFGVNDLAADLQDYTGLGNTGETVLTSPSVSGQQQSLFPLRFNQTAKNIAPYTPNRQGQNISYMGRAVMVSSRPMGFSNWTIATMIETQEAFAPITDLRNALVIIFLASCVIITIIAWYLARVFSRPIQRIAEVSKRIGQGDFSVGVDIKRKDEIGALAVSVNSMRDSLKAFVSGIESQRNHLAIILNSTNDSILAVNQAGIITTANQAALELAARPVANIVGRPMDEVFSFASDLQPFTIDYNAPASNSYANISYTNATGAKHYLKLIVARLVDAQGQTEQSIITIRDETKSRELESMKLDFVSMAAHELRTPLAAIRGYIELVTFKLKTLPPDISNYLSQALKSSIELSGLINNLLDVSRIERGTLTLNMERIDLATSITKAIRDVDFQAKERDIALNFDGPTKGYFVAADEIAIREVITNLLTNAIKYTPPGGKVDATLAEVGNSYTITVKDTGIGIPKDALPHLFTKFFRVHGGLDSGSTGTGLGLFIAKSIIERHDGVITAESKEGEGSTFAFTIPKLSDERLAGMQGQEQAKGKTTRRHRGWITKNTAR